ncbi:hypothetical protein [Lacticaseibacillus thailandensis]|uniref:Uncharacterized protein n=1 Tax=Lacticaseibacillus thailandensis DSM 22698 = JCM 13996 TaxID=1423810 RepID=A0A0R2C4N1_9LACO|nr:hypothetical protein [Lacticaseibacillus thailandensis]KRM86558.1 hypothetical protein FD19_GL001871 [Lacticaseibacillus thailandensis DSM 22698 = JCM 13996]
MLRLRFTYNTIVYTALVLASIWLTHTGSFGLAVIGSLALLYIAIFPVGSAILADREARTKAWPIIGVFFLIFFVFQLVMTVIGATIPFVYWIVLLLVYCITIFVFWRLDHRQQ